MFVALCLLTRRLSLKEELLPGTPLTVLYLERALQCLEPATKSSSQSSLTRTGHMTLPCSKSARKRAGPDACKSELKVLGEQHSWLPATVLVEKQLGEVWEDADWRQIGLQNNISEHRSEVQPLNGVHHTELLFGVYMGFLLVSNVSPLEIDSEMFLPVKVERAFVQPPGFPPDQHCLVRDIHSDFFYKHQHEQPTSKG